MAGTTTFFTSKPPCDNDIALGRGVTAQHFLRAMSFINFGVCEWRGEGKKCINKSVPEYEKIDKIDPPITEGITTYVEGPVPETLILEPYNYYYITFNWTARVIREGFAVSETSHMYGQYVGQREAARRSLREVISSLYAVRHSVLNLRTDLERLKEQIRAFQKAEKDNNWDMVKGIFVDNYGGQGRTWNDAARNVPLCKAALSWFMRLKELDEVDKAVDEKQLNPVVASYLKRKWQEYETWRTEYKDWLYRTNNKMIDLVIEQEQSEKLYMKWAKDNLIAEKRLDLDFDQVADVGGGVEFPRFVAKAAYHTEHFFYLENSMVKGLMYPWLPCALVIMDFFHNPDVQGWKFVRANYEHYWGSMHKDDMKILLDWVNLDIKQEELTRMLALRAGIRMEEMEEEMEKFKKEKVGIEEPGAEKKQKTGEEEAAGMIVDLRKGLNEFTANFMKTFVIPFGADAYERADVKRMRADAFSQLFFNKYFRAMRKDFQIPVSEA